MALQSVRQPSHEGPAKAPCSPSIAAGGAFLASENLMLLLRKNTAKPIKKIRVASPNSNLSPSVDVLRVILQLRPTRRCFSVQNDSALGLDREKRHTPSIETIVTLLTTLTTMSYILFKGARSTPCSRQVGSEQRSSMHGLDRRAASGQQ